MIRVGLRGHERGTIYVLQIGSFTKVGFSSEIDRRHRQYLAHNPLTPEFSHTEPGTRHDERMVQAILKQQREPGKRVDLDWYEGLTLYQAMRTIALAKRQISKERARVSAQAAE